MAKVLVAIDGSEHANRALLDAVRLFGEDADYVLMSVVPSSTVLSAFGVSASATATHGTAGTGMPFAPTPEGADTERERVYEFLREAQDQAAALAGITAERVIEEAKPRKRRIGRAICDAADEHGVDAVVVGSHGASYAGEAMLGSVSQYVLHQAGCPVVVSRDNEE